jgi:hypothetical protein
MTFARRCVCGAELTEESGRAPYFLFAHRYGLKRRSLTFAYEQVDDWAVRGLDVVKELSVEFHTHYLKRAA